MRHALLRLAALALAASAAHAGDEAPEPRRLPYAVVDTGQDRCYGEGEAVPDPAPGEPHFGQDAQYFGNQPSYRDNLDGTVTDLVTGLTWQKTPDFELRTWEEAGRYASGLTLAGRSDWRLPSMKELFSIADFRGNMHTGTPYLDTRFFDFRYPDPDSGLRDMDAQYWSSDLYVGATMAGDTSAFGFNFADGRIKAYPVKFGRGDRPGASRYVRCVRGPAYGANDFTDNGDGTVTDRSTGLTWTQADAGKGMTWKEALAWAEALELAGRDDWRLPDVKELHTLVDYRFAPDARKASARRPAIDPVFSLSEPESWFWTSTTHIENGFAYYVCFGRALSARRWNGGPMNAHGAGAVRSDPKSGDPSRWPEGLGPQSDQIRILNHVRAVRGGGVRLRAAAPAAGTAAASRFTVTTVGTGGPRYNPKRAGPSTLVRVGEARFLVDMGNGTQARLAEAGVDPGTLGALMFTHHHLDHDEEFVPVLIKSRLRGGASAVVGPPGTKKLTDFVFAFYEEDLAYRRGRTGRDASALKEIAVREVQGGESFELQGVSVRTAKVVHTLHTVAYRFDSEGACLVVSGDLSYSKNLVELARGADVLVMDSGAVVMTGRETAGGAEGGQRRPAGVENPDRAHASLEDVGLMAAQAGARKLVLTHFGDGEVDAEATRSRIAAKYDGEIVFGEDLVEIAVEARASAKAEAPPKEEAPSSRALRFIRRLDRDGDGRVSLEEFDGPDHHFRRLDRNGDGYLDASEAPEGPPGRRGR